MSRPDPVREQALAAHAAAQEAVASEAEAARADELRRSREAQQRVLGLVRESPLVEWFPGVEWEVYATAVDPEWYGMRGSGFRSGGRFEVVPLVGVVCAGRPAGTNPEWAGVPCIGVSGPLADDSGPPEDGAHDRVRVFYVHTVNYDGYVSWQGPEARSLEALGELIAEHEAETRRRLQREALAACSCARNGSDPCKPGLRCAHAAEHCARRRAADSANCEADVAVALRSRPTDRVAEEREQGYEPIPVTGNHEGAVTQEMRERQPKTCPERGGPCQHRETCEGSSTVTCWLRHARIAGEPEGRHTGLHRDSMG